MSSILHNDKVRIFESKHKNFQEVHKHFHETFQILYALEGHGNCQLGNDDYIITKDDVLIIPPFTSHSISANTKLTILVLEFDQKYLNTHIEDDLLERAFIQPERRTLYPFESSEFRQLLRKMLYEISLQDDLQDHILKSHLIEILCILIRSKRSKSTNQYQSVVRPESIKETIDRRYYELQSLEDLSKKVNVSKSYIQRIFKDQYSRTPMHYLSEVRIGRAKQLLTESDQEISSICFEVGFSSLATFYRIFKKHVGIPPNTYRSTYNKT
ncbi:transcriptional regulator, AraC family [Geomicrobium sp. JCM 19037]|uniref:helix-turn-helix transcriptional regulator n=1 Tax=unclassified Geomicrobium TaxID=2628951 RepID=UPI00045F15A7|nr:AraC family transcriptional regulator [Geomicrobium sp. JCM 19037]GAK05403.1 transcriptional regulator, AraC family [Geomicrobium sp. JCM 19037]